MTNKDDLIQFLNDIWGLEEGTVFLATKPSPNLFKVTKPQEWPKDRDRITQFITAANTQGDVYFTPGIFKAGSNEKEKGNGEKSKALWVDIDGYKDGQGTTDAALRLLDELQLPKPTYRIQSSVEGSEHWYWVLDAYIPAQITNEVNRRLAYYLNADKACWDISHVMRPPFTHNHKPQYNKPAVTIAKFTGELHDVNVFKALPTVKNALTEMASRPKELPLLEEVFAKYPWDQAMLDKLRQPKETFWEAERKDYVNRGNAMVNLAFDCAEIGMRDDAIFAVLFDCDDRWGKFKERNDREVRITEIVNRVRSKYPERAFAVEQMDDEIKQIYGFKEFLNSKFEYNWLVDGLIPANSINFVVSRPGIGKSRFTLQLAASLALGGKFLKWEVVGGPKKVVYFSLEMGPPILKSFVTDLAKEGQFDEEILDNNFKLVPIGQPIDISTVEGKDFFKLVLDEVRPDVVFIDAMSSLSFEDLGEKTSKAVSNQLKAWLQEYNCAFYIVHHNRKPRQDQQDKAPTEADFFGSTYGQTDAGSVIGLWKPPANAGAIVEMVSIKSRIGVNFEAVPLDNSKFIFSEAKGDIEKYAAFNNAGPANVDKSKWSADPVVVEDNWGLPNGGR